MYLLSAKLIRPFTFPVEESVNLVIDADNNMSSPNTLARGRWGGSSAKRVACRHAITTAASLLHASYLWATELQTCSSHTDTPILANRRGIADLSA
ncbi:uncharacterized protein EAE98_001542 [Botrytis deweyae]|uniref:Uncharacterized protein n=1 Tax=Botrytis deweyae TaxID=2478750 RepID=A0ABQ7IYC9_9HELO|nr:uncharacterized protein EAE98_001542 [Botrytis deweyae]KAF7937228.1 hypothetical protein EAE98_001542 [Botrytis deweyae]